MDRLVDEPAALGKKLIDHYGSIASVVTAFADGKYPMEVAVPPCVAEYFGIIADTLCRSNDTELPVAPEITSPDGLSAMLKREMLPLEIEVFRVIFLDGCNRVLSDQVMWTGTVNSVQAHPREIIKQAILLGATAIILAHNHPSSSAYPSATDLAITRNIVIACAAIDVEVHDHMIVAHDGAFSMRSAGILKRIKESGLFR
jgi:DNA repair protein RadC